MDTIKCVIKTLKDLGVKDAPGIYQMGDRVSLDVNIRNTDIKINTVEELSALPIGTIVTVKRNNEMVDLPANTLESKTVSLPTKSSLPVKVFKIVSKYISNIYIHLEDIPIDIDDAVIEALDEYGLSYTHYDAMAEIIDNVIGYLTVNNNNEMEDGLNMSFHLAVPVFNNASASKDKNINSVSEVCDDISITLSKYGVDDPDIIKAVLETLRNSLCGKSFECHDYN